MNLLSDIGPVPVVGAAAVSAAGFRWRGLASRLAAGEPAFAPSRQLASSHPGVPASEVPEIPPSEDAGEPRNRKLMSRSARLAAIAVARALGDAGWATPASDVGCFLGVGGAGGPLDELRALMRESAPGGGFSLERFAGPGLAATNPLFAFHLLNNYVLCHGGIAGGLQGPNGSFFSRGTGTALALAEAAHALASGECERALAGGADTALYAGTWIELRQSGLAREGLVPGEGAALLALGRGRPFARLERCVVCTGTLSEASEAALIELGPSNRLVIAPWGPPARAALRDAAAAALPDARVLDLTARLGEALAATPALAWVAALDLLVEPGGETCLAMAAGPDGAVTGIRLARVRP